MHLRIDSQNPSPGTRPLTEPLKGGIETGRHPARSPCRADAVAGPPSRANGCSRHDEPGVADRAFQASSAWDSLAMPEGRLHDRIQCDVPHLLGSDGPRRLPRPRTGRDGAPGMPDISPRCQSVACRHLSGSVPELRPRVRERLESPAYLQGVSGEEGGLTQECETEPGLRRSTRSAWTLQYANPDTPLLCRTSTAASISTASEAPSPRQSAERRPRMKENGS